MHKEMFKLPPLINKHKGQINKTIKTIGVFKITTKKL